MTWIALSRKNAVILGVALYVPSPGQVRTKEIPPKVHWVYVKDTMSSHEVVTSLFFLRQGLSMWYRQAMSS
jgi:hypothetical protein